MVRAGALFTNWHFFSPPKKNKLLKEGKLFLDFIESLISVGGNFSSSELWAEKVISQE
jgi:hypothetical protein